jgi:hypothetical protein
LTAQLVARAIRFVARQFMLRCSDAWTLRTLLPAQVRKWGLENLFPVRIDVVDKHLGKRVGG